MSVVLANRLKRIKPSPSVIANALVTELREKGRDIVSFTIGEPDFATPPHVIEAAIASMQNGDTHYTSSAGTQELRQSIVDKLKRDNKLNFSVDDIVVGVGGKHIIYHAMAATLNKNDEVIIPAPYWVSYPDIVLLTGGVPNVVVCDEESGFKLTPEALENAITPATRWLMLNSPSNPTGAVYTEEELKALADVLRKYDHVYVMSDEIYEHFVYEDARHLSLLNVAPDLKPRVLIVNGVSKGYAMTGWRIGFGAGPKDLMQAIVKLISQTTTCPSSVSQAAAVAAFGGNQQPVHAMADRYASRRKLMLEGISKVPGLRCLAPEGAFYLYVDVSGLIGKTTPDGVKLESDTDIVLYWLENAGVASIAGEAYGLSPYVRFSFATNEDEINKGCQLLKKSCEELC